ncbi:sucrase ferredoxin [Streptomyces sodiiphilus]|uniref:Sucrase ferredoxin n=1 Tax=Streptomyces sodiiphilus TaxID=226217 RepID=A0ABN2PJ39_9ACTN
MSTCATLSRIQAEPLAGTAPTAAAWLLVEQSGPWGAKALTQSRLDPGLGRSLEAAAKGTGVRVALIRRPGRHAEQNPGGRRRIIVAHTGPGNAWVRTTTLTDPRELTRLDLGRLGAGDHGGLWEPYRDDPLALVCTNGRRDRCCALRGRPLAQELTAGGWGCWEITHIGGHRFSPTLLTLPHGYVYGRVTGVLAKGVLAALQDGRMVRDHCRGRTAWEGPGQAAELAVRALTGEDSADALTVPGRENGPGDGREGRRVTVTHRDGRRWLVTVDRETSGPPLPASCGAEPEPQPRMAVRGIAPLP